LLATTGMPASAGGMQREGVEGVLALAPVRVSSRCRRVAELALPVGQLLFGQVVAAFGGQAPGQAVAPGHCEQAGVLRSHSGRTATRHRCDGLPSRRA
jgi:hypothetical protein